MEDLKVIDIFESEIADILPYRFKSDPEVLALSHAIKIVFNKYFNNLSKSMVIADIDNLSESILDLRAIELDIPYYTSDMDIDIKRKSVKTAIALYKRAGTKASIRAVVQTVLGNGEVIEWDKFNGTPGSFKIVTSGASDTEALQELSKIIKKIKNASATLIAVERITDIKSAVYIGGLAQSVTIQSVR
ncbi:MAG: phage tail protein I [Lachnospiraceae bacterium]|nr:MAG: phage tail protein I [Lachnospiraceae bacterium]DAV96179.1 MAG TPA: tail protein [Caudoviricetes sp.]